MLGEIRIGGEIDLKMVLIDPKMTRIDPKAIPMPTPYIKIEI